mmetsp:Transcript_19240/g.33192  ORF Transcript_19240/g.33192 Transcript_19240/m.33192 type:complete len:133 (-) Transcript_19240:1633-2031(-)
MLNHQCTRLRLKLHTAEGNVMYHCQTLLPHFPYYYNGEVHKLLSESAAKPTISEVSRHTQTVAQFETASREKALATFTALETNKCVIQTKFLRSRPVHHVNRLTYGPDISPISLSNTDISTAWLKKVKRYFY